MSERKLTIARGLARCKTIEAQLSSIETKIGSYGAWADNKKHPMGNTKLDLKANHKEAEVEVKALFQSFHDLIAEYVKIKLAIKNANMVTNIEVAGQTMTIEEALIHRNSVMAHYSTMSRYYNSSIATANNEVTRNNNQVLSNANIDIDKRQYLLTDVLYLVPKQEVDKLGKLSTDFLSEIDGELNAVNAVTEIVLS